MIRLFFHIFFIIQLATLSSCALKDSNPKIRLVDVNGKSRKIITRIPDLNLKALAQQGHLYSATKDMVEINNAHQENNVSNFKNTNPRKADIIKSSIDNKVSNNNKNQNYINKNNRNFAKFSSSTIEDSLAKNIQKSNNKQPVKEIEFDLSSQARKAIDPYRANKKVKNYNSKIKAKSKPATLNSRYNKEVYVQVGSFSKENNAAKFLRYMNKFNKGEIQKIKTISGQVYRVVLGPFSSIDSANKTVKMVKSSGHDALILINK